jgi:hypothetical protein
MEKKILENLQLIGLIGFIGLEIPLSGEFRNDEEWTLNDFFVITL